VGVQGSTVCVEISGLAVAEMFDQGGGLEAECLADAAAVHADGKVLLRMHDVDRACITLGQAEGAR